jgi:DNA-binding transcriptional ArsR family regulator
MWRAVIPHQTRMPSAAQSRSRRSRPPDTKPALATWTFLSNHAHVLICLKTDPDQRIREVADRVGITERAVQKILSELEQAGYLTRHRDGRRNTYSIHANKPLRHPIESHRSVGDLIDAILK